MTKLKLIFIRIRDFWRRPFRLKQRVHIRFGKGVSICRNTEIGDYTFVGKSTVIGRATSSIGSYCSIGPDCVIGANNHPLDQFSTSPVFYSSNWGVVDNDCRGRHNSKNTSLGHDVWVGTKVVVLPGVNIGTGAVIGAGSIVTKDVEEYAIVAGVPAKRISFRFDKKTTQKYLDSEWWKMDPQQAIDFFQVNSSADR